MIFIDNFFEKRIMLILKKNDQKPTFFNQDAHNFALEKVEGHFFRTQPFIYGQKMTSFSIFNQNTKPKSIQILYCFSKRHTPEPTHTKRTPVRIF
jgi:hypothetical protein